jgi:hypothetical protein
MWSKNILDNTDAYCTEAAAEGGNLLVLQYLRELGYPWSRDLCLTAVVNGNLKVLKWAFLNGCPWNDSKMFPAAASSKRPSVDLYQFLFDQGCPLVEEESFKNAANIGNFEFIQFAQSKGSMEYDQWQNRSMIQGAIRTGRLDSLEWSLGQVAEKGLVYDKYRTDEQWIDRRLKYCWICLAAEHGHVHILEYLRVWFGDEFWVPAKFGRNDRSFKVKDIRDVVNAKVVKLGHVNVLDWIVKYSTVLDWDKSILFKRAVEFKKLKVLIWLKSHSTDDTSSQTWFGSIPSDCPHPSDLAFAVDDFEIFKWIHNQGCPWNDATDWVHLSRSEPYKRHFVNFAAKNGCPNADKVRFELKKMDRRRLSGRRIIGPSEEGGRTGEGDEEEKDDEDDDDEEEEEEEER